MTVFPEDNPSSDDVEVTPPKPTQEEEGLTFLDHLEDVRKTLIGCALALVIGVSVVASFISYFSDALIYPLRTAMAGRDAALQGLVTTGPMGVFSVMIQVCLLGGFFLALPAVIYFVARFVAPALTDAEKRILRPACLVALILFLSGAAFSYFLLVPASLKASVYFNEMFGFATIWRADSYYGLLVWMVLGVGACFEFPLLVFALVRLNVITVAQLRQFRSYSIVLFLSLAAIVTPTADPFTFLLLAIPMMIFYEASIIISERFQERSSDE